MNLVEALEDDEAHSGCPQADEDGTEQLGTQEAEAMAVEETFARGEEPGEDGACEAAYTVYGAGADGIVYLQHLVDEVYGEDHQDAADGTDDGGTRG